MFNPFREKSKVNSVSSIKDDDESRSMHREETWNSDRKLSKAIKDDLEGKQGCVCSYCGNDYSKTSFGQIDHFLPKSLFPQFTYTPENLVLSCQICNSQFKRSNNFCTIPAAKVKQKYPDASYFSIVHPILDDPECHFELEDNSLVMKLLTPKAVESNKIFHLNMESILYRRARVILDREFELSENGKALVEFILSTPRG